MLGELCGCANQLWQTSAGAGERKTSMNCPVTARAPATSNAPETQRRRVEVRPTYLNNKERGFFLLSSLKEKIPCRRRNIVPLIFDTQNKLQRTRQVERVQTSKIGICPATNVWFIFTTAWECSCRVSPPPLSLSCSLSSAQSFLIRTPGGVKINELAATTWCISLLLRTT